MTATQTIETEGLFDTDDDEVTALIAAANAAQRSDPRTWLDQIDWIQVSEDGDTWRECRDCGIPEDEMCAWCGCDCQTVAAGEHPVCTGLNMMDDFLREYGS